MKKKAVLKDNLIFTVSLFFILLFVYAGANKLLDFGHFRIQLGKSPLLSSFAELLVFAVPLLELIIVALLCVPRFRRHGLWASFFLMVLFTAYIAIMLSFSSYVPCSCGGILENMSWRQHLVFNVACCVSALGALMLSRDRGLPMRFFACEVMVCLVGGTGIVAALYAFSDHETHRNNGFVRRYPHHPVEQLDGFDLKFDSYYVAGFDNGKVYFGNSAAPRNVLAIDTAFHKVAQARIRLEGRSDYSFSSVQLKLSPPYFFIGDGTVPVVYRGLIADWTAKPFTSNTVAFSQWEPADANTLIVRTLNEQHNNALGLITKKGSFAEGKGLLQKQQDGIFDTDGLLNYDDALGRLCYVYYYRNQFVSASSNLQDVYRGRTIDTISQARLRVAYEPKSKTTTLSRPPVQVQQSSCASGRYLFIMSGRLGRYESQEMLKHAAIIDVYDLVKHTYEFSFYLYDYNKERVRSFKVCRNLLIGITEHYAVRYRLKTKDFNLEKIR